MTLQRSSTTLTHDSDSTMEDVRDMHTVHWNLLIILSISGLVVVVVAFAILFYRREVRLVKMAQPIVMYALLLAIWAGFLRSIIGLLPLEALTCTAGMWLEHFAFSLMLTSIAAKSWRVHVVLNSGMRKVKVSKFQIAAVMTAVMAMVCGVLIWCTLANPFFVQEVKVVELSHHIVIEKLCTRQQDAPSAPVLLLFFIQVMLMFIALYYTYLARGVKSNMENAQVILFVIVMYCSAAAALSGEKRSPTYSRFAYLLLVVLTYWKCFVTFFGRLVYSLVLGFDLNEQFQLAKRSTRVTTASNISGDSLNIESGLTSSHRCTVRNVSQTSGGDKSVSINVETSVTEWRTARAVPGYGRSAM